MQQLEIAAPDGVDPRILRALQNLTIFSSIFGMGVIEFECTFKGIKGEPSLSGRINAQGWTRDLRWAFAAFALFCGTFSFCFWCYLSMR